MYEFTENVIRPFVGWVFMFIGIAFQYGTIAAYRNLRTPPWVVTMLFAVTLVCISFPIIVLSTREYLVLTTALGIGGIVALLIWHNRKKITTEEVMFHFYWVATAVGLADILLRKIPPLWWKIISLLL